MKSPYHVGVGVAALVCYEGKILFQNRTGAHGANTWAPPGGKLDYGETPEEGLRREIKEETGLSVHDVRFVGHTNDIFTDEKLHFITLWYVAVADTNNAKILEPNKCLQQGWYSLADAPSPLFIPTKNILNNKAAVKVLKEYL